jgi:hypothetical protein
MAFDLLTIKDARATAKPPKTEKYYQVNALCALLRDCDVYDHKLSEQVL